MAQKPLLGSNMRPWEDVENMFAFLATSLLCPYLSNANWKRFFLSVGSWTLVWTCCANLDQFLFSTISSPLFCARMSRITSIKNSAGIAIIIYSTDRSLSSFLRPMGWINTVWKSFWYIGLHYDCSRAEFDRENFSQTFCTLSNVCAAWVMQQTLFGVTVSFPFDRF